MATSFAMWPDAARNGGMKFGLYLSPWDRHEPFYKDNKQVRRFLRRSSLSSWPRVTASSLNSGSMARAAKATFTISIATCEQLRIYQPNALIFADAALLKYGDIRWVGNESGFASEENWNVLDLHGYLRWRPAEADTPLRKDHWFWHPNDEKSVKSVAELLDTYEKTVGRGAQLMIGIAPDDRGLLPDSDVQRLAEFGAAVRSIYGADKNLARHAHVAPSLRRHD